MYCFGLVCFLSLILMLIWFGFGLFWYDVWIVWFWFEFNLILIVNVVWFEFDLLWFDLVLALMLSLVLMLMLMCFCLLVDWVLICVWFWFGLVWSDLIWFDLMLDWFDWIDSIWFDLAWSYFDLVLICFLFVLIWCVFVSPALFCFLGLVVELIMFDLSLLDLICFGLNLTWIEFELIWFWVVFVLI